MDRNTSSGRATVQPQGANVRPQAASPTVGYTSRNKSSAEGETSFWRSKKFLIILVVLAIIVASVVGVTKFLGIGSPINKDEYQAVFLSNGQVYFGKLKDTSGDTWQVDEVYYLQQNQQESEDESGTNLESQSQPQLIKLGQEIHKPHSTMYIRSDQVLFWENIQNDGKVAEAIKSANNQQ